MNRQQLSRRSALLQGGAAWATLAGLQSPLFAQALPSRPGEETLQWMDQPPANPSGGVVVNLQPWETLTAAQTPTDKFFQVAHYDKPVIDEKDWKLEVAGLVRRPLTLTLADLKSRPRQEVPFTLECAGNHGFPWFTSGIGTATLTGGRQMTGLLRGLTLRAHHGRTPYRPRVEKSGFPLQGYLE